MQKSIPLPSPGEILREDFLEPMGITPYRLAQGTKLDQTRISEILHGKRAITADTALRFSKFFGNSPEFWTNLQSGYDLRLKKKELHQVLKGIRKHKAARKTA